MKSFMHSFVDRLGKFSRANTGLAAVEFGLIAPILVTLFLGTIEGADALSSNRRVAIAANTLADLVAQETTINQAQLNSLYSGMEEIAGVEGAAVEFRVISLIRDPDQDQVVVHWSRSSNSGAPYTEGAPYTGPANVSLLDANSSVIVSEIIYDYAPPITDHIFGAFTMKKDATRWPRRTFRVQFCTSANNCTS